MVDLQPVYATSATASIAALTTLANGSSATSTSIQNTAFFDYIVAVTVTTTSGATVGGYLEVYAQGSLNNVLYDDTVNDKWLGTIALSAAGVQTRDKIMTVAAAFGGTMPPYFKLRIKNVTGAALSAGTVTYRGSTAQTV